MARELRHSWGKIVGSYAVHRITARTGELARKFQRALGRLGATRSRVIDGELIATGRHGKPDFLALLRPPSRSLFGMPAEIRRAIVLLTEMVSVRVGEFIRCPPVRDQ